MKPLKTYEQEFADLYRKTSDAELAFIKAFNKWAKLRKQCIRAEKRLEKALNTATPPLEKWTDLADAMKQQEQQHADEHALLELHGQERLL